MNTQLPLSPQARKIQDLQSQHSYLLVLREDHLLWIKQTHDPEIIRKHFDIADLIGQLADRYQVLLETLLP